jgi:hypothetical protein
VLFNVPNIPKTIAARGVKKRIVIVVTTLWMMATTRIMLVRVLVLIR